MFSFYYRDFPGIKKKKKVHCIRQGPPKVCLLHLQVHLKFKKRNFETKIKTKRDERTNETSRAVITHKSRKSFKWIA